MEYSSGTDYGYDQIHIGSEPLESAGLNDFVTSTNANRLHNIDKIREREVRLLKKLNQLKPNMKNYDYENPSLYNKVGSFIEQQRMDTRKNIEDHYFSGRELRLRKKKKKRMMEGFKGNMKYIQDELDASEKKNDTLIKVSIH